MFGPVEGENDLINGEEDETIVGSRLFPVVSGSLLDGAAIGLDDVLSSKHGLVFAARERNGGVLGWEQRDRASFE